MPGRAGPKDSFQNYTTLLGDPAGRWVAVNASDAADLPFVPRAVYVGSAGNLSVVDLFDNTTLIQNVPAGSVLPGRWKQIRATGTTASALVIID